MTIIDERAYNPHLAAEQARTVAELVKSRKLTAARNVQKDILREYSHSHFVKFSTDLAMLGVALSIKG